MAHIYKVDMCFFIKGKNILMMQKKTRNKNLICPKCLCLLKMILEKNENKNIRIKKYYCSCGFQRNIEYDFSILIEKT